MKIKLLLICGFIFGFSFLVTAQQVTISASTDNFTDYLLTNTDGKIMPPHQFLAPIINGDVGIKILEQQFSEIPNTLSTDEINAHFIFPDSNAAVQTLAKGIYRAQEMAPVLLHRARYNESSITITKRLKVRVYKSSTFAKTASKNLNTSSPFAQGDWYKIPISSNNIYAINVEYLQELGISTSTLDPRKIQIWGTGGYQLPELNQTPKSDFKQIPILVKGESDGSFDTEDKIIFYANSPHKVVKNGNNYSHELHPYSDVNYVYLTISNDNGQRLSVANNNLNPTSTITSFTDFIWKDEELSKPEDKFKSGRYWLGQSIPSTLSGKQVSILKDTLTGVSNPLTVSISGLLYARSEATTTIDIDLNGIDIKQSNVSAISGGYNGSEGPAARPFSFNSTISVNATNNIMDLTATVTHRQQNSVTFVDWIRLAFERELIAEQNRLYFYTEDNGNAVSEVSFHLQGFTNEPTVLDVSNPVEPKLLATQNSGNQYLVNYFQNDGRHIIAQSAYATPKMGVKVENQNLRGVTSYPNYIVITSEALKVEAQKLADYREQQGLTPIVVTQEDILNEFSNGVKDPTALRDYLKFLWDRSINDNAQKPEYVLLFGDTSYDTKNIIPNALTNHVLTYQSKQSIVRATGGGGGTFGTDDYFGYMDDQEGDFDGGNTHRSFLMDLGIGRITAQTRSEANNFINKIKRYEAQANAGDWQNLFTFAADDDFPEPSRNRDLHTINADVSAELMNLNEPGIRLKKIYTFSYEPEITGAGRQIPGATADFIQSVNQGTLVLNYSGHGNEQTLSDEELFLSEYIPNFINQDKLTVLVTATCQFGRYDDTSDQSGAEKFVSANNGGAIASFTTTRVVYTSSSIGSSNNFGLNIALSQRMSERRNDAQPKRLGDIMRATKNSLIGSSPNPIGASTNNKKFILIGDPATTFKLPSQKAIVSKINEVDVVNEDTTLAIRALDQVTLKGSVLASNDLIDTNFNGETTISVYDGRRKVSLPEREWNCVLNNDCTYKVESDLLFKGKVSVTNGEFAQTFIIPKDISTSELDGRILLYANGETGYASGAYTKVNFNGINPNAVNDGTGPEMNIYLNDEKFVNGNLVNDSPNLVVEMQDNSGINTTGTGVGHEIIATIDTKPTKTFILNDFYEGNLNDFTGGRIEYPLDNIPEGSYTLKVRAWDVHNNFSEKEIFFEVASQSELQVRNIYNFPNPMNNKTQFTFEHNQPGNPLDVSIKIYTLSGKPVQYLKQESLITTNSYANIPWNGRDRDNDRLGNGTYIYVLRVTAETSEGPQTIEKIEKLVIIR